MAPATSTPTHATRGPLSTALLDALTARDDASDHRHLAEGALARTEDIVHDDDIQLSLFLLYASAYGSLPDLDPSLE